MSRNRLPVALLYGLLITAAATGCRKTTVHTSTVSSAPDTLIAGTVIKSSGSWTARTPKGSTKLEVTVSGNSVNWTISTEEKIGRFGSSSGSSSSGTSLSSPSDPWFVFVESPQRLWFFNGKDQLSYTVSDGGGSRSGPAILSGQLQPTTEVIPPEIAPHLPAGIRSLLPPVEPVEKRPSI
jgi:hypothetical protein